MLPLPDLVDSFMQWMHVSDRVITIGKRRFVCTDDVSVDQILADVNCVIDLPDIDSENKIVSSSQGVTVDWREQIYSSSNMLKDENFVSVFSVVGMSHSQRN